MPLHSCPACNRPAPRLLAAATKIATVNIYQCASCGHLWTTDKDTDEFVRSITPLP
jgi:hypothetical protein